MKKLMLALVILVFVGGCAGMQWDKEFTPAQDLLVEQTVDALGFTIGALAVKDESFRHNVEFYYSNIRLNGLTVVTTNEILSKFKNADVTYQLLAYKIVSLIQLMGGQLTSDGLIESFGGLTQRHLEIGKQAYLTAIGMQS